MCDEEVSSLRAFDAFVWQGGEIIIQFHPHLNRTTHILAVVAKAQIAQN